MKNFILLILVSYCGTSQLTAQDGWFLQNPFPTTYHLYDISVIDPNIVVMVGEQGSILRTNDGGYSWQTQYFSMILI